MDEQRGYCSCDRAGSAKVLLLCSLLVQISGVLVEIVWRPIRLDHLLYKAGKCLVACAGKIVRVSYFAYFAYLIELDAKG